MTGPLPDPRDPTKKGQIRVIVAHTTTTECADSIDAEIETIADAIREFAAEYAQAQWDVMVTNEISPARDETREPHEPQELHRFWSLAANNVDLFVMHPRDNGSTALGEFEVIALNSPGQPLVLVPEIEGVKISRAWKGQARKYGQVRFKKVPGRGKEGLVQLERVVKRFLWDNIEELEGGPRRRRMVEVAMLPDAVDLQRDWETAPAEVRSWIAGDLKFTQEAVYEIISDPMEIAALSVFNYLFVTQALSNPDTYTVGRGHQILGDRPMGAWSEWSKVRTSVYAQKLLRTAIVRTERAKVEVSTPVDLSQAGKWTSFANEVESGR